MTEHHYAPVDNHSVNLGEKSPIVSHGFEIQKTSSLALVFANIVKSFIGAGLLGIPYGTRMGGYVATPLGLILMAVLNGHCIMLMVESKRRLPAHMPPSYESIGELAFGTWGKAAVQTVVCVTQVGFCTAYVVFIGQNLHVIVPQLTTIEWTLCIAPLLILLSWIRQLKYLAPFSMLANVCLLYGVLVVVVRSSQHLVETHEQPDVVPINISTFLVFLGIAIFAFEGVGLTIPIESSMEKPEKFRFLLWLALTVICLLLTGFGLFEYIVYGNDTQSLIVSNIPYDALAISVMIALCLALLISFPVQMFPVSGIVENTDVFMWLAAKTGWPETMRNVGRMLLCFISCGVAIALGSNFSLCVSLIGCIGGSTMAFIMPGIFHWKLTRGEVPVWVVVKDWSIAIFGLVVGMVMGSVVDIIQYIHGN